MDYLITFYEENSKEPKVKNMKKATADEVIELYSCLLRCERNGIKVDPNPSKLFTVDKLECIADNS